MRPRAAALAVLAASAAALAWEGPAEGSESPRVLAIQAARWVLAGIGDRMLAGDLELARALAARDRIGEPGSAAPPFVFERRDEPHLVALRSRYDLDAIVSGEGGEYAAMMRLAAWIGTRFEHGTDEPPGGHNVCDPVGVIEAGRREYRFWCEIAARTLVHAAAAVGWPARMITVSEHGYRWDHAVAELWSNEFDKWFVVDPDFNLVFEAGGVPMSAWEMVHDAPRLAREGRFVERRFAREKEGLNPTDFVDLYQYVHVDLRTDWCTRTLARGSPAGGDRSTWWTARPGRGPLFTASVRTDRRDAFDWPVNRVSVAADDSASPRAVRLSTYSPVFSHFEHRFGNGPWQRTPDDGQIGIGPGAGTLQARVVTVRGDRGPLATVRTGDPAARRPAPAGASPQRAADRSS